ncbi:hypothetical protein FQR65_LT17834 [Abscondita terminalis]|nr:hypothetical protein FQR65_LT17834 [Abscondita terminalis]
MANKLRTENIKSGDDCGKKNVEDFLLLWEEEIPVLVNKKALEDQVLQSRQKKIALPSKKDIKLLFDYLKKQANISYELLVNKFDIAAWNLLNQYTLILIQIFNRRRAGEIERLKLTDYYNKQALDDNINKDLCFNLSAETMKFAKQYVRLTLRGKLSRTVSVLLSPIVVKFLDILLKYRKHAGIKSDNEYVFAATNTHSLNKKYIRACPLMRKFSFECGALIPSSLRGTTLRKHIATFTAMLDIEETQVDRLANFMGHHKEIHKDIYRIPVPVAEMTDVSRLLVAAMGGDEEEENEQSAGESDSSAENYNDEGDHNNFTTAHSSNSSQNCNNKRRSTSPYGKTKRLRWSTSEKAAVISYFGKLDDLDRLPSLTECQKAIRKFEVLCRRQPQQLKSFIDNQRKLEVRREAYAKRK